ncbi:MAG: response regulator transcription factor [Burkholderiaceae bacterium]|nr:response regulator transcription factor [Burkholderiaceae bacterium]
MGQQAFQARTASEAGAHSAGHRFLVVDDHPMVREAILQTVDSLEPGSSAELATSFGESMKRLDHDSHYDYVVLDLNLPDSRGHESLAALKRVHPELPVIVLSASTERDLILQCLDTGALGYIPKTLHADVIKHALRLIVAGHVYVPQEVVSTRRLPATDLRPRAPVDGDPRRLGLTERQIDVLRLILKGYPNKLICRDLDLAEGTVKVHVSAVLRALGVRTRTQAVIAARELGLRIDH